MNDRKKARLLWVHTEGFRGPFSWAILAMAIAYIFMFGAPLLATFSIDAILAGDDFKAPSWAITLASVFLSGALPTMMNYLVMAALGTVLLTTIAGAGAGREGEGEREEAKWLRGSHAAAPAAVLRDACGLPWVAAALLGCLGCRQCAQPKLPAFMSLSPSPYPPPPLPLDSAKSTAGAG